MRSRWFLIVLGFVVLGSLGCSGNNSHSDSVEQVDAAEAGNHDSGAGESDAQAPCVPQAGPDVPDEGFVDSNCDGIDGDANEAIFVAPNGLDGAPGNRGAPVRTIQRAVELATSTGKSSVYICNGEYAESVHLVGDAVSLYGGYACENDWERTADRAIVRPASGVPLTIEGAPEAITISHLLVRATDVGDIGASSIALVALGSKGLTISHSEIMAGRGGPGRPGVPRSAYQSAQQPASSVPPVSNSSTPCVSQSSTTCTQSSTSPMCDIFVPGAVGTARACPGLADLSVNGGKGGRGGNCYLGVSPELGFVGVPAIPAGVTDLQGADGLPGTPATVGFGSVRGGRYFPTNTGADGLPGSPGYAGRGGSGGESVLITGTPSVYLIGNGGPQGGYPGCPGLGGQGGGGGGASIAVVAQGTPISSVSSLFSTGDGGIGGPPGPGGPGQIGGAGGVSSGSAGVLSGSPGQKGGDGGAGGMGGPGGGGPSIGIVYDGEAPTLTSTVFSIGKGGIGPTFPAGKGADGVSAETYAVAAVDGGI